MWSLATKFKSGFELSRLSESVKREGYQAIQDLRENPFPAGYIKLDGYNNLYRIRFAKVYRIVYIVSRTHRKVVILRAAHRSIVYTGMARNPEMMRVRRRLRLHQIPA